MIHSESGGKYEVSETQKSPFEITSTLSLLRAEKSDEDKYSCVAKNSLSVAQAAIRVYSEYIQIYVEWSNSFVLQYTVEIFDGKNVAIIEPRFCASTY